ncbi:MAG: DUF4445 domain-containing protein [Planctomycetes bacterium]|nr:DUF4445 domain-containing protein [Planctomycetota bacterium]
MMVQKARGIIELPDRQIECEVEVPTLLIDLAEREGIILNVACGGKGTCGGCAVDLLSGKFSNRNGEEISFPQGSPHRVLSCQTVLLEGPFRIRVPRYSLVSAGERVVMDFAHAPKVTLRPAVRKEHIKLIKPAMPDQRGIIERIVDELKRRGYQQPIRASVYVARKIDFTLDSERELTVTVANGDLGSHIIRIEQGDTTSSLYGVAVDVGTTTVVVSLVDLNTGKIIDTVSSYNQQIRRCDDVASRIAYASNQEGLEQLRELVVESTINRLLGLLQSRHGLSADDISYMTVAGNTVMTHLLCGISPVGLGGVPFIPVSNFPGPYRADQLHLLINPEARVDLLPSAAGYIGGDITADMLICNLTEQDELTVLVDVGTNAEIVVGNRNRLIACAAPAGPAFEGSGITAGMRASTGAIDSFKLDDIEAEPEYTVIGDTAPVGICGSGLIDFVAQVYRAGIISATGRFTDDAIKRCPRVGRFPDRNGQEVLAYEVVSAEQLEDGLAPIIVTERDIATLLQAKGVIFAALQIALKHFGKAVSITQGCFDGIKRFYLAGGFARHVNLDNAVIMGLLPDIDREKYTFIGNGSLAGAYLTLLDEQIRDRLPHITTSLEVIELNLDKDFEEAYTLAMLLPEV